MSKIQDMLAEAIEPKPKRCLACAIYERMPAEDFEAIRAAYATGRLSQRLLARILTDNGYPVGSNTIRKHIEENHEPQL